MRFRSSIDVLIVERIITMFRGEYLLSEKMAAIVVSYKELWFV